MSAADPKPGSRPREVTFAGVQAVTGSFIGLLVLIAGAGELNSTEMRDRLTELINSPQAEPLGLTLDTARELTRYTIMAMGVVCTTSLILGIFVLRRHQAARIVLTVLGILVAVLWLFAGPPGWLITAYVAISIALLWRKSARAWFADPVEPPLIRPPGPPSA